MFWTKKNTNDVHKFSSTVNITILVCGYVRFVVHLKGVFVYWQK